MKLSKKISVLALVFILVLTSVLLTACQKNKKLISAADALLAADNAEHEWYSFNGTYVEENDVKVYYVTTRHTEKAYQDIDEACAKSQYPDMTKKLLLNSLAKTMRDGAQALYQKLEDVFAGTDILRAVALLDDNGKVLGTYDENGWST